MEEITREVFIRLERRPEADGAAGYSGDTMISASALKLHTYGVVVSIESGRAGFVSDDYLNALPLDTATPALELSLVGLWRRDGRGYRVDNRETLRIARAVRRQLTELEAPCPEVKRFAS